MSMSMDTSVAFGGFIGVNPNYDANPGLSQMPTAAAVAAAMGMSPSLANFSHGAVVSAPAVALPPPGVAVLPPPGVAFLPMTVINPMSSAAGVGMTSPSSYAHHMPMAQQTMSNSFNMEPQVSMSLTPPALMLEMPIAKPVTTMTNAYPPPDSYGGLSHSTYASAAPSTIPLMSIKLGDLSGANLVKEELEKKIGEEGNDNSLSLSAQENMSIKGESARHLVMQKLMRNERSPVIVLKKMVTKEDVDDALKDEITDECNNFGAVVKVIIYEKQSEDIEAPVIVKICVEFSQPHEDDKAKSQLHGRFFGGRRVICESYEMDLYKIGDYSG